MGKSRSSDAAGTIDAATKKSLENSEIFADLVNHHGPLMEIDAVAKALKRDIKAIKSALGRTNPKPWAETLKKARVRHGRNVLFKTSVVAYIAETDMP